MATFDSRRFHDDTFWTSQTIHSNVASNSHSRLPFDHSSPALPDFDGTVASRSHGTDRAEVKNEHTDEARTPVAEEVPSLGTVGAESSTSNARASRLFRERRKEREKILRETVAELVERNAALETLLMRHGINPPLTATLRHELSVQRSQRLGGPAIHIPGLTPMRSASIPCVAEAGNHGSSPSSVAPASRTQEVRQHSFAPSPPFGSTLSSVTWPPSLAGRPQLDAVQPPPALRSGDPSLVTSPSRAFDELLHIHAQDVNPMDTAGLRGSIFRQPLVGLPEGYGSLDAILNFQQPFIAPSPALTSPQVQPQFEPFHHIPHMNLASGSGHATVAHTRSPSDSALFARIPTLTSAEQRVIGARSGPYSHHIPAMPMQRTDFHDAFNLASPTHQPQLPASSSRSPYPNARPQHLDTRQYPSGGGVVLRDNLGAGASIEPSGLAGQSVLPTTHLQDFSHGFPYSDASRMQAPRPILAPIPRQSRSTPNPEQPADRSYLARSVIGRTANGVGSSNSSMHGCSSDADSVRTPRHQNAAAGGAELQTRSLDRSTHDIRGLKVDRKHGSV